jgi:hypothetical protein
MTSAAKSSDPFLTPLPVGSFWLFFWPRFGWSFDLFLRIRNASISGSATTTHSAPEGLPILHEPAVHEREDPIHHPGGRPGTVADFLPAHQLIADRVAVLEHLMPPIRQGKASCRQCNGYTIPSGNLRIGFQ